MLNAPPMCVYVVASVSGLGKEFTKEGRGGGGVLIAKQVGMGFQGVSVCVSLI